MRVVDAKKKKQRVQKKRQIYGPSPRLRVLSASLSSSSSPTLLLHSNQRFVFPFFATQATLVVIKIRSTHTIKNCWKTSPLCAPSFSSFCVAFSLCHLPRSFLLAQEYSKNTQHTLTRVHSLSLPLHTVELITQWPNDLPTWLNYYISNVQLPFRSLHAGRTGTTIATAAETTTQVGHKLRSWLCQLDEALTFSQILPLSLSFSLSYKKSMYRAHTQPCMPMHMQTSICM